ncbi:MAG: hypothetical protein PVJ57_10650 [Phycisphaerae bacterium]|jgi:hypothetical protein
MPKYLLAVAIVLALLAVLRFLRWRRMRKLAAGILNDLERIHVPRHEYRPANPGDFPHVDQDFYDGNSAFLSQNGFRFLADMENVTVNAACHVVRTYIRTMLADDGTTAVSLYDPRRAPEPGQPAVEAVTKLGGVADFGTDFTDGTFIGTSNAPDADVWELPPQMQTEHLGADATLTELIVRHAERVVQYADERPDAHPVVFHSLEDVLASAQQTQAVRAAHRRSLGMITREELRRLAGGRQGFADELYAEIQRLRAKRRPAGE